MKQPLLTLLFLISTLTLSGQWIQTNGPEGANTYDIQKVGDEIWAATGAGLYISEDEGANWILAPFLPPESAPRHILVTGTEILLTVAVFESVDSGWSNWDYFLYRSTDFGLTWTSSDLPLPSFGNGFVGFFKIDNSILLSRSDEIYRSDDNGNSWQNTTIPVYISRMASNGDQLLVSNYFTSLISEDKGTSWTFVDSIGTQSDLFMEDSLILIQTVFDSIHISENLGENWTVVPSPGRYGSGTKIKRGNSGALYFLDDFIFVSDDNGYSWDTLTSLVPNYSDMNNLVELPNDQYLVGTDDGVFQTARNSSLWSSTSNNIIGSTVYHIKALPSGDILTNTNLGNFRSPNFGGNWFPMNFDFYLPSYRAILTKGDSILISVYGNILLSTDNLNSVDTITSAPNGNYKFKYDNGKYYLLNRNSYYSSDLENWDSLIIDDPNNSSSFEIDDIITTDDNALLATTDNGTVYRSGNNGVSWIPVLEFWAPGVTDNYFYKINDRIYLVDDDDWFYTIDNGLTWSTALMEGLSEDPFEDLPTRLAVIGDLIFGVTPSNGVYLSTDLGDSWEPTNVGLGSSRPYSILYNNDQLYLGTINSGVWKRGTAFESVAGFVYSDQNNNGIYDPNESPLENILLQSTPLNTYTTSNNTGAYSIYTEVFNDTIRAIPPSIYTTVQPEFHLATSGATNLDFGIALIPNMDDLSVTLTNVEPFRPGFDNRLVITVSNVGTTTLTPTIKIPIENDLTFLSADLPPTQTDLDTLIWVLAPMDAFTTQNITLELVLDAATDIGTLLTLNAQVLPTENDQDTANNFYALVTEVVGAFDPNDKQVSPTGNLTPTQLAGGEKLTYTVRFQNTGNYFAQNVRVIDTISNKLDLTSFRLLSASHPVAWSARGENIIEFLFENILLPDSISNEPDSHGYIKFSIQPKSDLSLGDEINNFVDIYFDFNEPVRTNTIQTVFDLNTSLNPKIDDYKTLLISPNPAMEHVFLSLPDERSGDGILEFYDVKGTLVLEQDFRIGNTPSLIEIDNLVSGFYSVRLKINSSTYIGKVIKQ